MIHLMDFESEQALAQSLARERARLQARRLQLEQERALRYAIRSSAIAAVDPTSSLSRPRTLRESSATIERNYRSSRRRAESAQTT